MSLPHRFPFRFVDRLGDRRVTVGCTAGAWWHRGGVTLDGPWLVEAAAQAAALLLQDPAARADDELRLAAVELAHLARPLRPGERIEIAARLAGRLGRLTRVEAIATAGAERVGEVVLTLSAG